MPNANAGPGRPAINQIVVVLTPVFAFVAAAVAGWAARKFPGLHLDGTQITALMVLIATSALTMAVKWLHGWQAHEAALRAAARPPLPAHANGSPAPDQVGG
jgi:hypothetical protein